MSRSHHVWCTAAVCLCAAGPGRAQQSPTLQSSTPPPAAPPVAAPAPQNPATLEELEKRLVALEKAHKGEISELRSEIEALEDDIARARAKASLPATQSASAFNPAITVFGNFLARGDSRPVFVDDDPSSPRVDDRFLLREVELDFRAAIDPWADGVVIATFEAEEPGEYEAGI